MSTIAIIQCRLGSSRFPKKALADLCNRPVIWHVASRALQIRGVDRVIVAVPSFQEAAIIAQALPEDERLSVFASLRVEENDVLGRFVAALENYPEADPILRLTADSPMIQPEVCERVLNLYRESGVDYAWNRTTDHGGSWPDGLNAEALSRSLLERLHREVADAFEREHVTAVARRIGVIAELGFDQSYAEWPKCSIDCEADLQIVRELLSKSGKMSGVGTC